MSRRRTLYTILAVLLALMVLSAIFYLAVIVPPQSAEMNAILTRQAINSSP